MLKIKMFILMSLMLVHSHSHSSYRSLSALFMTLALALHSWSQSGKVIGLSIRGESDDCKGAYLPCHFLSLSRFPICLHRVSSFGLRK